MELVSTKTESISSEVIEVRNPSQIKSALLELLSVPDEKLKPKIVSEIVSYFESKFSNPENKVRFFVASQNERTTGLVSCQIDILIYINLEPLFHMIHIYLQVPHAYVHNNYIFLTLLIFLLIEV